MTPKCMRLTQSLQAHLTGRTWIIHFEGMAQRRSTVFNPLRCGVNTSQLTFSVMRINLTWMCFYLRRANVSFMGNGTKSYGASQAPTPNSCRGLRPSGTPIGFYPEALGTQRLTQTTKMENM